MCEGCWTEHGRPTEWGPEVDRARGLILAIESACSTCAPLHALVENWNIDGQGGDAIYEPLDDFEPHIMEAARELAGLLRDMSVAERASTLAYASGYADTPPGASRDWEDLVAAWLQLPPSEPPRTPPYVLRGAVMKVYLATRGEYSDYGVVRVFARREDADAYELADDVEEYELTEGPVEVRAWHHLLWFPDLPDREQTSSAAANPSESTERRDFDGHPAGVIHEWYEDRHKRRWLGVSGWDINRVRKVYSEQRAQYIATQDLAGGAL